MKNSTLRKRRNGSESILKVWQGVKALVMLAVLILGNMFAQAQNGRIDLRNNSVAEITHSDFSSLRATFSYGSIESIEVPTERGTFSEIAIEGTYPSGEIGTPELPATHQLLAVPFGATPHVRVISYSTTDYRLSDYGINTIMPHQPSVRKDQRPEDIVFAYNAAAYRTRALATAPEATIEVQGTMRGIRIGSLVVNPVSYNPTSNILRVFNNVEVEVSFEGADYAETERMLLNTYSPYFDIVYKQMFNYRQILDVYSDHPDLMAYPVHMIVITPENYMSALQPWLNWKIQKGFDVNVYTTSQTGTTYSAIRSYVQNLYNTGVNQGATPTFLILVGDVAQVPNTTGSSTSKVTDLYYGSVDSDYFPDMFYSRMSAENTTQLTAIVDKILQYEQYTMSAPSYLNNVTLIAGWDSYWTSYVGAPTINYATTYYYNTAHGFNTVNSHINQSQYSGCYNALNTGVGFVNYTAHGSETSWAEPSFTVSNVNQLTNTNKYFLAIGNCCLSGNFGYSSPCFGEAMIRGANKAAYSYIGSCPNTYWYEDYYFGVGATSTFSSTPTQSGSSTGVYDAVWMDDTYNTVSSMTFLGNIAVCYANAGNYQTSVTPLYYWQAYHVLGDGSIMPYRVNPTSNTVSHASTFPAGASSFLVHAQPGSYVGISQNNTLLGAALVPASGSVNVPVTPVSSGQVKIVVTKPQRQPYIQDINVDGSAAPTYVSTNPTNRNVIIEEYTGRSCGYCPDGHRIANELAANNPGRVFAINLHTTSMGSLSPTSFPNLNTTVATTLTNAFAPDGIPMGVVNRSTSTAQNRGNWENLTNAQLGQVAECNVGGEVTIDPVTRTAYITVEVYYTGSSNYDQNYLTVAMLQDSILGSQSDFGNYNPSQWVGNQYCHMHTLRDVITQSAWGDAISPTTPGSLITRTYTYQIPETIGSPNGVTVDMNNIYFLAWVSETYQGTPTRPILTGCKLSDSSEPYTSYTITATANPSNGGTVTGGGSYLEGATCTLIATANSNYSFTNWTKNGAVVSTNPTYSFTVTGNADYVANFSHNGGGNGEIVEIGDGTGTTYYGPYNSLWGYSFVEQVYAADEIGMAGTITSISFNMSSTSEQTTSVDVFMKNVSRDSFSDNTDWEPVTASDMVYSGTVTFSPGWTTITLDTPFEYDGLSNLMIGMHEYTPGYSTRYFYYTAVDGALISAHSDSEDPDPYDIGSFTGTKYVQSYRINVQLNITTGTSEELTVYDGSATNGYVPVYGFYCDAYLKSEFIMPAATLSTIAGGTINRMEFYATQNEVSWGSASFQVFMKEVDYTNIDNFSGMDDATIVYEGSLSITDGIMDVTFTTPYHYSGRNLLIGFYEPATGSYVTSTWYGETASGASVQGYSYSGLDAISPTQRNFLPKTTFHYIAGDANNLVATPDPIDLGYRPNGAWMRPVEVNIYNVGAETTLNSITVNNPFFLIEPVDYELPYTLGNNQSINLNLRTNGTASGVVNANLVVNHGDNEEAQFDVTATAYDPVSPDVWELAPLVTSFPYTATLNANNVPLYDNYRLPPTSIADGADAVYKLVFTEDTYLNAAVTNGENGKVALYPEDFHGIGGPDLENSYTSPQIGGNGVPFIAEIGEGIITTGYFPFYTLYNYSIAENLFLASELAEAGVTTAPMTSLSWYATNAPGYEQQGISIWMANVNDEALTSTSHVVTDMILVYTGTMTPEIGWNEFVFNEGTFAWDGQSNVLIFCQRNNGSWNNTVQWQATDSQPFTCMTYRYQDSDAYDPTVANTMYTSNTRPNIIMKSYGGRNNRDDLTYDFEDNSMQGWTTIDADGDGYDWMLASSTMGTGYGYNGSTDCVLSQSYNNNAGALNPDNYLVSPQMTLGGSISFWACAQDNAWASEHFGVAVSTTNNISASAFTTIQEWTMTAKGMGAPTDHTRSGNRAQGNWYQYTVDLSAYTGQTGYVAIRHFNCTDMFYIDVDDITVGSNGSGGGNDSGAISDLTVIPGTYYLVASSTSNDFTVEINTDVVPCPEWATNPHPVDAATEVSTSALLTWDFDSRATEYRLMFGTTYYCEETLVDWTDTLTGHYFVTGLNNNTNYFWRVDQRNDGCPDGVIGQVWGFTTHLNVPLNLYAYDIITQGDDLTLTWDAPGDRSFLYYNVYQDNELVGSTYDTCYTISNLPYNIDPGYYFNVTAVYDEGESNFSNTRRVRVTGEGTIEGYVYEQDGVTPIQGARIEFHGTGQIGGSYWYYTHTDADGYYSFNMVAGTYNGTASHSGYQDANHDYFTITYNELTSNINFMMDEFFIPVMDVVAEYYPDASNPNSEYVKVSWNTNPNADWLYYDDGIYVTGVAYSVDASFYWGVKFDMTDYTDAYLTKVSIYDRTYNNGNILIYQGGEDAPGILIYQQPYVCSNTGTFVEHPLSTPVSIDPSQPLWIVLNNFNGSYPAACCNDTGDANGRWISTDGYNWADLASYGFYYTWMIRGYVRSSNGRGETMIVNGTTQQNSMTPDIALPQPTNTNGNGVLSTDPTVTVPNNVGTPVKIDMEELNRSFQCYRVYRTDAYNAGPYTPDNTVLVADEITDTLFIDVSWPDVEMGMYKYGVSCVYSGNRESEISWGEMHQQPSSAVVLEGNNRDATFSDDFESGMDNWTTIDADGDGYNWILSSTVLGTGYGHNGSNEMVYSQSYDNNVGVLNPDNYLITPQLPLGGTFGFWACAQDAGYAAEHFGLAVSTSGNTDPNDFTMVQEWTMTAKTGDRLIKGDGMRNDERGDFRDQGNWYYYEVNLSEYAGQIGYIAIRHFNCYDMFYLNIDDVEYINNVQLARESAITWSNFIDKDMYLGDGDVNITVTLNSGDSPEGTLVRFINLDSNEQQNYPMADIILDATGYYAWDSFRKGDYQVTIVKEGYETVSEEVSIWNATDLFYVMTEIIPNVGHLYVSSTGWAMWDIEGSGDVFEVDFENGLPDGWIVNDANNDGYTWTLTSDIPTTWTYYSSLTLDWYHNGSNAICSGSYLNGVGALTPDEYLISPLVNIANGSQLSFWVAAADASYPADHFGVFVSTTGTDPSDFQSVQEWTLTAKREGMAGGLGSRNGKGLRLGNWYNYTVDLSAYAGNSCYIAFRHFDCYDQYIMCLDDIVLSADRNGGRHYEYNQVMLTDVQDNVLFSGSTEYPFIQLPVDDLVEGQTYHCKVANVYSSGMTGWTEVDWVYQACDNYEGVSSLYATATEEGNLISWEYPENVPGRNDNNLSTNAQWLCLEGELQGYPASVDSGTGEEGPNYGCLYSTPNPSWYYLRIATPGNLNIYMYSDPGVDIDFCCWGPFDDPVSACPNGLTEDKIVSCSYSANWNETCYIPETAQTGEYYILLLTNYSNQECNFYFEKQGGSGTTDCENNVIGAMVYRDNELLGFTRANNYLDEGEAGNHQYDIRVVYNGPGVCPDNNIYYSMSCMQTATIGGDEVTQVSNLAQGWNWWSTYIEQDGIDGLTMLENSLGANGHQIKSQTDFVTNFGSMWMGMLTSINNEETYMLDNYADCQVVLTGTAARPSDHPITVSSGWSWIGYPCTNTMSVAEAFSGYTPSNGDQVKSQSDYAMYYGGMWIGQLQNIVPGMGLMYKSNSPTINTLVYPNGGRSTEMTTSPRATHWTNDIHAYPNNMTVMAVVELDGQELSSENYELAAFDASGECRGSVRLMYVEPINRYMAFLTVSGLDAAELNFGLYDIRTGREYFNREEALVYVTNATIGNPEELYVVRFRSATGLDELASSVQVFPNPVQGGERFSILTKTDVKQPIHVEVVNALGATIAYETSTEASASFVAPMTAGVYMLRIHIDGLGTCTKKLIIR